LPAQDPAGGGSAPGGSEAGASLFADVRLSETPPVVEASVIGDDPRRGPLPDVLTDVTEPAEGLDPPMDPGPAGAALHALVAAAPDVHPLDALPLADLDAVFAGSTVPTEGGFEY
jgi:hypothetical protein